MFRSQSFVNIICAVIIVASLAAPSLPYAKYLPTPAQPPAASQPDDAIRQALAKAALAHPDIPAFQVYDIRVQVIN